jgi:sulfur relay protein TusB/DsrH
MLLHIFKHGITQDFLLQKLINNFINNNNNNNTLLLIQNGVYWGTYLKTINFLESITIYALQQDIDAREIAFLFKCNKIKLINYPEFVELVLNHDKIINW